MKAEKIMKSEDTDRQGKGSIEKKVKGHYWKSQQSQEKLSKSTRENSLESSDKNDSHRRLKRRRREVAKSSSSEDESWLDSSSSSQDQRYHRKHRRDKQKHHKKEKLSKKEEKRERRKKGNFKRSHHTHKREKVHKTSQTASHKGVIPSSHSDSGRSDNDFSSSAEVMSGILKKFPEVANDLGKLMGMIDDGQAVDITGLTNKHLAAYLKVLFRSLHLHQTSDGLFLLPEGASRKTLDTLGGILCSHSNTSVDEPFSQGGNQKQWVEDGSDGFRQDGIRLAQGVGEGEHHLSQNTCGPSEPRRRVIGPAMPSAEMLAAAAKLTEASSVLREAEEELELDALIGPPPPAAVAEAESANEAERFEEVARILSPDVGNAYGVLGLSTGATLEILKKRYWKLSLLVHPDKCSHPQAHQAFTALNQAFKDLQDPTKRAIIDCKVEEKEAREEYEAEMKAKREAAQWRKLRGESLPDDELLLETLKVPTRDEWMTSLPPERKAGPPPMQSTFFSKSEKSGRGDTSAWTDSPLEKAQKAKMQYLEAYKQAALTAEKDDNTSNRRDIASQAAAMIDQFNNAKRSLPLVEKHHLEHSKKSKEKKPKTEETPIWSGNHPWKPWDREKDLVSGRQTVKLERGNMSEALSSRFSSSHEERSFL